MAALANSISHHILSLNSLRRSPSHRLTAITLQKSKRPLPSPPRFRSKSPLFLVQLSGYQFQCSTWYPNFNVSLLNITTSFVAEEQALVSEGGDGYSSGGDGLVELAAVRTRDISFVVKLTSMGDAFLIACDLLTLFELLVVTALGTGD
ncbi:hypothetical protein HS088_TW03G01120 [Tripterygium wilfordii]|uniref:Uncharacterized protein n=1 Tax=Tripterygium wilfordii TaxID=458696 RepID=A0A7J7DWM0_TRIWF|nr:hypothetical protein HS088_TW03G01120 [Tripterygium wilfordii]